MTVDEYLDWSGLDQQFWQDPQVRQLVQLLLMLHAPTTGLTARFLSGTVIMGNRTVVGGVGVVRDVAEELLEAAISGRMAALMLGPPPATQT